MQVPLGDQTPDLCVFSDLQVEAIRKMESWHLLLCWSSCATTFGCDLTSLPLNGQIKDEHIENQVNFVQVIF